MTPRSCGRPALTLLLAGVVVVGLGCRARPRAPALEDTAVYQNESEGFRFLVPEGWSLQAKSGVPPGRIDRDLLLVLYRRFGTHAPAVLQVSLQDLPADADLARLLADSRSENTGWRLVGKPAEVKVGSRTGRRFVLEGKGPTGRMAREVIAVRQGERVYFFTGTFSPADHASRDLIRQTFAKVVWK